MVKHRHKSISYRDRHNRLFHAQSEGGAETALTTFSAEAAQQLGDVISLTGRAKLGASEYVYGGGVAFDLSNGGMNTNSLGVNYSYIDGKNGIEDDQRVELSWAIGFGAGPSNSSAAADLTDKSGTIRAAADVSTVTPANNLLSDVMKRPTFLPERVLARAAAEVAPVSSSLPAPQFYVNQPSPAGSFDVLGIGFLKPWTPEEQALANLQSWDTDHTFTVLIKTINGAPYNKLVTSDIADFSNCCGGHIAVSFPNDTLPNDSDYQFNTFTAIGDVIVKKNGVIVEQWFNIVLWV